jgi:hypothetical protein
MFWLRNQRRKQEIHAMIQARTDGFLEAHRAPDPAPIEEPPKEPFETPDPHQPPIRTPMNDEPPTDPNPSIARTLH